MLTSRAYGGLAKLLEALRTHDARVVEQLAKPQAPSRVGGVRRGDQKCCVGRHGQSKAAERRALHGHGRPYLLRIEPRPTRRDASNRTSADYAEALLTAPPQYSSSTPTFSCSGTVWAGSRMMRIRRLRGGRLLRLFLRLRVVVLVPMLGDAHDVLVGSVPPGPPAAPGMAVATEPGHGDGWKTGLLDEQRAHRVVRPGRPPAPARAAARAAAAVRIGPSPAARPCLLPRSQGSSTAARPCRRLDADSSMRSRSRVPIERDPAHVAENGEGPEYVRCLLRSSAVSSDRIALITGGNRGLGRESASRLAALGMHVLVGSRDTEAGEATARQLTERGLSATAWNPT